MNYKMRSKKLVSNVNLKFNIQYSVIGIILFLFLNVKSQSSIERVLSDISNNNEAILANKQFWEAKKLHNKTGIFLDNPTVEYDYLSGSPAGAGNQQEFSIMQSFDFPTVYRKKSELATEQSAQAELELIANRQNILLQVKINCIELIYYKKLHKYLMQQLHNTEKLLGNFKIKLEKGDGTILDVNKVTIQLIEIKKKVKENEFVIERLKTNLTSYNGGVPVSFEDTSYFEPPAMPLFVELEREYELADPLRKILEQDKSIAQHQIKLSKALSLPKFELGYHYQGILGQTYNGIHTGISIPLWENKNTVKAMRANLVYSELKIKEHRTQHYFEIKGMYDKCISLMAIIQDYKSVLDEFSHIVLLDKALELGQITTIDYFTEINYYVKVYDSFYLTEKEYFTTVAELFKYLL